MCYGVAISLTTLAVLALGANTAGAQVRVAPGSGRSRLDAAVAAATFDSAWRVVRSTHYDSSLKGLDWNAVRAELLPEARSARDAAALREVIGRMLARLEDSHLQVLPAELLDRTDSLDKGRPGESPGSSVPGDFGFDVRLIGGRLLVVRLREDGPARGAGVRTGWALEQVGRTRSADALESFAKLAAEGDTAEARTRLLSRVYGALGGESGTVDSLWFTDESDRRVAVRLVRRDRPGVPVRFASLPTIHATLDVRRLERRSGCVGVIAFNVWLAPLAAALDDAVDRVRECDAVIIDLRGNSGGVAAMVMGVAGHFLAERVALGTMRTRGGELRLVANPRFSTRGGRPVRPFAGPVAILIDQLTASTSEFFASALQAIGRARVFGERSAGQALPATLTRLPNGDVLLHVIADFVGPTGHRIEGIGTVPDEPATPTRADLLAGRDVALAAAMRWIDAIAAVR